MRTLLPVLTALFAATLLTACGSAEDRAANYIERAQTFFDEGDFVKARLDLRTALKIDRDNIEARMLLARVAEQNRNYRAMYNHLVRILALDENNVDARVKLGILQLGAASQTPEVIEQARDNVALAVAQAPENPDVQVLQASLKRFDGDFEGATAQMREVLTEHSDNVPAHSLLFSLLYQQGQVDEALVALEQGIAQNPSSAPLHLLRLQALQSLERWEDVESGLKSLSDQFPDSNAVRYQLAKFYIQRGQEDDAEVVLESLVANDPDDSTAKLKYAEFLANRRDLAKAEEALQSYSAAEPQIQEFRFALATLYQAQRRNGEAIEVFESIVSGADDAEDRSTARNELAKLYMREGRIEEARPLIDGVLEDSPGDPEALILRAGLALQDGQVEDAITDLRAARRNDPDSKRALTLLAQAHAQAGDGVLAEERLRDLLAAHPNDAFARDRLAGVLFAREQFRDVHTLIRGANEAGAPPTTTSVRLLAEALIRDGRPADALTVAEELIGAAQGVNAEQARLGHYLAGRAHLAAGDYEAALTAYREVAALGEMTSDALSGLVTALVELERPEEALSELETYLKEHPDDFAGLTLQGQVLSRTQRMDEAREVLERSLAVRNDVWPTYRDLISVNVALNDVGAAIEVADRGLAVAPENTQLRVIKAQLLEREEAYLAAIAEYETLLGTDPSSLVAINNLASLVADHDRSPERLDYAAQLARPLRTQSNPVFLDTVGWLAYRLENFIEARSLLEQAVRTARAEPRYAQVLPQLRYHLGMTYVAVGESALARTELEAAIAEDGVSFVGVQEARATLSRL
ncbi:MAG: tetratricopeptide repeat protein [Pseudomonadota bacterium]